MTEIYLIRHGESTWNSQHRWAGHADPPLSDPGRTQARVAALSLRKFGFQSVASSVLTRAWETASILAYELGVVLSLPVPQLNERHFGEISGLTSSEIEVKFPGLVTRWRSGEVVEIPGGEAWPGFVERVLCALKDLSSLSAPVLAVSHEGVLRAVEHHFGKKQVRHSNLEGRWVRAQNHKLELVQ